MRKAFFPIALAALFGAGLVSPVLADRVGTGWISIEQATQKAKEAGYTEISKINADDGRWEGRGLKNGKNLGFHMDPKTGAISDEHPND